MKTPDARENKKESAPALVAPLPVKGSGCLSGWRRRLLIALVLILLLVADSCFGQRFYGVSLTAGLRDYLAGLFGAPAMRLRPVSPKGVSAGAVRVIGRDLFVGDKEFFIRGVGYQPTQIGKFPWSARVYTAEALERDMPILRAMGCNSVRVWGRVTDTALLDACWNQGEDPLYVIMGFTLDQNLDYADTAVKRMALNAFEEYVRRFHRHPAVLMWAVGNENNLRYSPTRIEQWYRLFNEMGQVAYKVEGEAYHPVAVVNGALFDASAPVGSESFATDDTSLAYVDIWGANLYPGRSFGEDFRRFARASQKPLWISEFGIDAWDNEADTLYEAIQADWTSNLWDEIAASDVTVGASLMEYSDEWWKDPEGTPMSHDRGGFLHMTGHPDKYSNEEWFGVVAMQPRPDGTVAMIPRPVYYALQDRWLRLKRSGR